MTSIQPEGFHTLFPQSSLFAEYSFPALLPTFSHEAFPTKYELLDELINTNSRALPKVLHQLSAS